MDKRTDAEKLAELERHLTRRNGMEAAAGAVAIVLLGWTGLRTLSAARTLATTVAGTGHLLAAAGLAFAVLWLLWREARNRHRAREMASPRFALRQRCADEHDLLVSAGTWYVMPLVPGFALIFVGLVAGGGSVVPALAGGLIAAALLALVWWLNRRAAVRFADRAPPRA